MTLVPTQTTETASTTPSAATVPYTCTGSTATVFETDVTFTTTTFVSTVSGTTSTADPSTPTQTIYVFTNGQYFSGAFLPTIIAVLFAIPWVILDAHAQNLEPFHQLSKNDGAPVFSTLCIDYSSPLAPVKTLIAGHWVPFLTSLLNIAAKIITPLAPEFISVKTIGKCNAHTIGCVLSLKVFSPAGRAIQALLSFMALSVLFLILQMRKYSSGVLAEPNSIAGLATLFSDKQVRDDFRMALLGSSEKQVYESLMKHRYKLEIGSAHDLRASTQPTDPIQNIRRAKHEETSIVDCPRMRTELKVPFCYPHRKGAVGRICVLLALLATIIYYHSTDYNTPFERFMDSQSFGVAFLFTSIGVLINLSWSHIFQAIATIEPYRRLSTSPQPAETTLLIPKLISPLSALLSTINRGQILLFSFASSILLVQALTVCLSNIHFKTSTTYEAFTVSFWLSCAIIAVMLGLLAGVAFRRESRLALRPKTIAAVLCYLARSSVPERFEGMVGLSEEERNRRVCELGLEYRMWVDESSELKDMGVIDLEPLTS